MNLFRDCLVFGAFGLALEVCFTWFFSFKNGKALVADHKTAMGYTHPFYALTYASVAVTFFLFGTQIFAWNPILRFGFYAIYAFIFEIIQNVILGMIFGEPPSKQVYLKSGKSFRGLVRWDFSLAFGIAGFAFEWLYHSMHQG